MRYTIPIIFLFFIISCNTGIKYELVIANVSLFDGNEDRGIVNLGISGGQIAAISKDEISGDSIIDATDKFIIPGLVNAHTHAWRKEFLEESFGAGVLTMVNLHQISEALDREFRQYRDSLGIANFYSSGVAATVPGGHPTEIGEIETIDDSLSIDQFVLNRVENGADLIKAVYDTTSYPPSFDAYPSLTYDQIEELINLSHQADLKCIIHAVHLRNFPEIARLKPDGFAHMWFFRDSLTDEMLQSIRASEAFIIPTALTQERILSSLEDDSLQINRDWGYRYFTPMEIIKQEIFRLYNSGIPIITGTDPPNGEINYGDDLFRELEIYQESGLPLKAVLQTATGNAAKYLDIDGNGLLKTGNAANFLILNSNPLGSLSALKDVHSIWKNGRCR